MAWYGEMIDKAGVLMYYSRDKSILERMRRIAWWHGTKDGAIRFGGEREAC